METVRVEAVGNTLRGHKIWLVGDESLISNRLHVVEQELLGRGRRVLIINDQRKHLPLWAQKKDWDAFFHIRDTTDYRLALTYITNTAKPVLVVWLGEEPPAPVLTRLTKTDTTILGHGTQHPRGEWDVLFFSGHMDAGRVEETLMTRMGSGRLAPLNLRSVIQELQAVRAGLVWSLIDEPDKHGSVYWYDIAEGEAPREPLNPVETAHLLHDLADRIASAK
jgi:hypothetical protein